MTTQKTEKGLFLRYRHGTKLIIQPNIKAKLHDLAVKLEKAPDYKELFRETILPINDGSGYGIHPDSTWEYCAREIFEMYERDNQPVSSSKRLALISLLKLISDRRSVKTKWNEIKTFVLDKIEELSFWDEYSSHRPFFKHIKRDKKGNYYQMESGQKVIVLGVKTQEEEKFEFIANDCAFRKIKNILKLVALVDIADEYKYRPEDFSPDMVCVIPESDYSLFTLSWQWHIPSRYDYYPIGWRPRSCYSDTEWLSSDLVASYAAKAGFTPPPETPIVNPEINSNTKSIFENYPYKLIIALKTGVVMVEEPLGDKEITEAPFQFFGRTIIWQNGNKFVYPNLIVPCVKEDMTDGMEIAHKFISLIVKQAGQPIVKITSIGLPASGTAGITQPRTFSSLGLQRRYVQTDLQENLSNNQWVAYALYKEGVNADSDFYAFLSFYKIVELAFKGRGGKISSWIDSNIDKITQSTDAKWKQEVLQKGETASAHLYTSDRCAIAHFQDDTRGVPTNPDDLNDLRKIQRDLPIARALANEIFNQNLL